MKNITFLLLLTTVLSVNAQEYKMMIYGDSIPNSKPNNVLEKKEFYDGRVWVRFGVTKPEVAVYLPTKQYATGQAVLICPGGGYWFETADLEGTDVASYLNSIGVAAIILKYRLPLKESCIDPSMAPLMDAQRAMRLVRHNASKWNIDRNKIGVMGFSAGGHLASTLGTHFDLGKPNTSDSIERISCRPDFMILMYPVVSFADSVTHKGSRRQLLGDQPSVEKINFFSNNLHVNSQTPPTFILHANDDAVVPVENAFLMNKALRLNKIPCEMHILSEGGHGFGIAADNVHVGNWTNDLKLWLISLQKK
jgi:acetyl esterase/lipase